MVTNESGAAHPNTRFPDVHTSTVLRRGSRRLTEFSMSPATRVTNRGSPPRLPNRRRIRNRTPDIERSSHSFLIVQTKGRSAAGFALVRKNVQRTPGLQSYSTSICPAARRAFRSNGGILYRKTCSELTNSSPTADANDFVLTHSSSMLGLVPTGAALSNTVPPHAVTRATA